MICKQHTEPNGGVWMSFHRENWREWISWDISWPFWDDQKVLVQLRAEFGWLWRFYIPISDDMRAVEHMTVAPVAWLIFAGRAIRKAWFYPAKLLRRHGLLSKYREGYQIHWFWFQYIGRKHP